MLVLVAVPASVYLGVVAVPLIACRRRLDARIARATVAALAITLLLVVIGIGLFEAVASWYRPYGDGVVRRTESFREWAEIGFVALYAALIVVGVGCGWLLGRLLARRGRVVAVAVGIAIVGFLAATFPFVEWLNACHVGGPLFRDEYVACG